MSDWAEGLLDFGDWLGGDVLDLMDPSLDDIFTGGGGDWTSGYDLPGGGDWWNSAPEWTSGYDLPGGGDIVQDWWNYDPNYVTPPGQGMVDDASQWSIPNLPNIPTRGGGLVDSGGGGSPTRTNMPNVPIPGGGSGGGRMPNITLPGGGGGSSVGEDIWRTITGGGGGLGDLPWGTIIPGVMQALAGAYNADEWKDFASDQRDVLDPFGRYRPQYGDMLSQYYSDPAGFIENLPGYKAERDLMERSMLAKAGSTGQHLSGNLPTWVLDRTGEIAARHADRWEDNLARLAGADIGPGAYATTALEGMRNQQAARDNALMALFAMLSRDSGTNINIGQGGGQGGGTIPTMPGGGGFGDWLNPGGGWAYDPNYVTPPGQGMVDDGWVTDPNLPGDYSTPPGWTSGYDLPGGGDFFQNPQEPIYPGPGYEWNATDDWLNMGPANKVRRFG